MARESFLRSGQKAIQSLKHTCHNLRNDVQQSLEMCASDFQSLGSELIQCLQSQGQVLQELQQETQAKNQLQRQLDELLGNIQVICRIKPSQDELSPFHVSKNDTFFTIQNDPATKKHCYQFTKLFYDQSTNQQVYQSVSPLIQAGINGFHSCIFAYGQTGSGKTHTMSSVYTLAVDEIFSTINSRAASHLSYQISVNMVEIYNEIIYDLLHVNPTKRPTVDIRQSLQGVYLQGTESIPVTEKQAVLELIDRGNANRSVFATNSNEHSSRSHCVLLINIRGRNEKTKQITNGKIVLVDLAGSERLSKTEATGDRLKEAQHINKSLSAIGDVMAALHAKERHVPFRNSKLTHLLQDSLGKNNKAMMIVHINPSQSCFNESLCSLNFAARVNQIELGKAQERISSTVGQDQLDQQQKLLRELKENLAAQAEELKKTKVQYHQEVEFRQTLELKLHQYRKQLQQKQLQVEKQKQKHEQLQRQLLTSSKEKDTTTPSPPTKAEDIVKDRPKFTSVGSSRPTPLRRSRRSSLSAAPAYSSTSVRKRPAAEDHSTPYKSILKKSKYDASRPALEPLPENTQLLHPEKQVKFNVPTIREEPAPATATPLRRSRRSRRTSSSSLLGPATRVASASTFSTPASRVLSSTKSRKPKWKN